MLFIPEEKGRTQVQKWQVIRQRPAFVMAKPSFAPPFRGAALYPSVMLTAPSGLTFNFMHSKYRL